MVYPVSRSLATLRQHIMKIMKDHSRKYYSSTVSVAFLIWFCLLQDSVTCFTIPETLDRRTIIVARNKSANHTDAHTHAGEEDVPNGSNFTLMVTAPIAAGIFLTVILFFYCILFKDLTKKTGNEVSVENYERLPYAPDAEPADVGSDPQPSTSTSATNHGYVAGPTEDAVESGYSSNFQTTTASIEHDMMT